MGNCLRCYEYCKEFKPVDNASQTETKDIQRIEERERDLQGIHDEVNAVFSSVEEGDGQVFLIWVNAIKRKR